MGKEACEASQVTEESDGMAARRKFCLPLFVPSLLQGKSTAVVTPMLPIFIQEDLGGSVADVGLVASTYALAQVATSVPVGFILAHFNHRYSSMAALVVCVLASLLAGRSSNILQLLLIRFVAGAAANSWNLARKVWIAAEVPKQVRGRITGTLTGMSRWAGLLGALLGGVVAEIETRDIFLVQAAFSFSALAVLMAYQKCENQELSKEPAGGQKAARDAVVKEPPPSIAEVLRASFHGLWTAGTYALMLNGCRQTWLILLPMQGRQVGLNKATIGCLVAAGKFVDGLVGMTISGELMDRWGRRSVGAPAMLIISLAYWLSAVASGCWGIFAASMLFGLGNGLTGGIASTLSADLAPTWARAQFMGLWKMVTSNGSLLFPMLFGLLASALQSLDKATYLLQLLGIVAALWLWFLVPETCSVGDATEGAKENLISDLDREKANARA